MTTWSSPLSRAPEAVFQQTVPGQSPDQEIESPCRCCGRRTQTTASGRPVRRLLRAIRRARAELSQADRMTIEAGDDASVRTRFERDVSRRAGRTKSPAQLRRPRLFPGARKPDDPQVCGVKRIELVFRQRPVPQSELDRNIVKPARREAAIEMPQSRNDHPDDRDLDVGARLIEDEEIEARALGELHAGGHLLALVELAELRAEVRSDDRSAARRQIGMVLQPKRTGSRHGDSDSCSTRLPAAHETDGQKLIELGHRAQRGDARIEMRAGTELDELLRSSPSSARSSRSSESRDRW